MHKSGAPFQGSGGGDRGRGYRGRGAGIQKPREGGRVRSGRRERGRPATNADIKEPIRTPGPFEGGDTAADSEQILPVYIGELPATTRNSSLGFKAGNAAAIDLGVVILATMFDQFHDTAPRPEPDDRNSMVAKMNYDEECFQKQRPLIVIHKSGDLFIALPVYTYNGRGVQAKSAAEKAVHLHLHDCRKYNEQELPKVTDGDNDASVHLFAIMHGRPEEAQLLPSATWCRFDQPVSMSLTYKKVKILGKLTDKSAKKLFIRHYLHAFHRIAMPVTAGLNTLSTLAPVPGPPQSPQASLADLAIISTSKQPAEDKANDESSSRSSRRRLRSSGSGDLRQLDDNTTKW